MISLKDPLLWVAVACLAFTAGFGVMIHSMLYGARAKLQRRIQGVVAASGGQSGREARDLSADAQVRRKMVSGKLKELDAARQRKGGQTLRRTIVQAGLSLSLPRFFGLSAAAGVAAALVALVVGIPPIVALCLAVIAGLGLPRFVLVTLAARRVNKFTAHFADAIDIITRGIRSGLPVSETFNMIAQEMADPMGAEFRIIVESQRLGLTLEEALARACERVPTAELRFFGIVLAIQQTTGGNLAETLAKLADVLRARKRMRDKIQAMSGEAKASATIIGALPVLVAGVLAVVSPQYVGMLFTTPIGHILIVAGLGLMGVGVLVMRKMINFEF